MATSSFAFQLGAISPYSLGAPVAVEPTGSTEGPLPTGASISSPALYAPQFIYLKDSSQSSSQVYPSTDSPVYVGTCVPEEILFLNVAELVTKNTSLQEHTTNHSACLEVSIGFKTGPVETG
jgi:hypothetical protein